MQTTAQTPVHHISRQRAMEFLWGETQGRIFSAYFEKQDGTMRRMTCRRGVTQHLAGGDLPYDPKPKLHVPVWDMRARDYRMVNVATLVSFTISGETFLVV